MTRVAAHAGSRYRGRLEPACLTYRIEESTPAHIDIAVSEKHGDGCAGDPATSPVIDRFRVPRDGGALLTYDPVEGEYR